MSDKHSILGDTTLATEEGKRLTDLIEGADDATLKLLGGRMNKRTIEIARQIAFVIDSMVGLNAKLKTYYITAHSLRSQANTARDEYELENNKPDKLIINVNEKWSIFLQLYHQAEEEFAIVDNLPEVLEIYRQLKELYNQYEELILLLGSMISPTSIDEP